MTSPLPQRPRRSVSVVLSCAWVLILPWGVRPAMVSDWPLALAVSPTAVNAANPSGTSPALSEPQDAGRSAQDNHRGLQLAQVVEGSVLYFRTPNYTMHVFRDGDVNRMNVFNNATGVLLQRNAIATLEFIDNFSVFSSQGTRNGERVIYRAVVSSNDDILNLQIFDFFGRKILEEPGLGDALINLTSEQRPVHQAAGTILAFDTNTYSTRVFQRQGNDQYLMNVYNRLSGASEQNGISAILSPPVPPYDRQVSYVSRGTYNGVPAQFFTRIDGTGQTALEIISNSGQRLLLEPGVGPVTVNIPSGDLPQGIGQIEAPTSVYVAAVFGDSATLSQIRRLYPDAFLENSHLGSFINTGTFNNRNLAQSRVLELRGRGYNSRLVYRSVQYR
ncbi:hypothetical protein [Leptolyngbya sp. PCC 6406]|uniref:hypothetical protein n=1 Tax=Leptolyngbya sp. PCC 6406 TaxID=1173264 RepID=UPI0002ACA03F|nr:hypothetical protein [Leptolyngbya sp. PCC 6406]